MQKGLGVVIGRFQVPSLHTGHVELIQHVLDEHGRVLIALGSTPGVQNSKRNPLDFFTRQAMIRKDFPHADVTILPLKDRESDQDWSTDLDNLIESVVGDTYENVVLYGSRDSFIPHYSGRYPTVNKGNSNAYLSGSAIREMLSDRPQDSPDFRAGVIYAAYQRRAVTYMTVDIAVFSQDRYKILLGRKITDPVGGWRFPGGFLGTNDATLEDAARRELLEETGIHAGQLVPFGSVEINDWRYRKEPDRILTMFFGCFAESEECVAGDDLHMLEWFTWEEAQSRILPYHKVLLDKLSKAIRTEKGGI